MPENPNQSKKVIAALLVVLAVALAAWWFLSKKTIQPAVNVGNAPSAGQNPPSPRPEPIIPLGGNVLSIAPEKREMTIGTYRVENNKAVLAAQQTIRYTRETSFVREGVPQGGKTTTTKISDQDVRVGDLVNVTPATERLGGQIVAAEVSLINLPPPPPRR